jgi:group I intron endonuclease
MKVDYSQAKIYKITNDYNNDIYVGSTCDTLVKRFSVHKRSLTIQKEQGRELYKLMNQIGFDRFRIELIENFPCQDKYQLRQKEGEYIRSIGTLNMVVAGRTKEERYEINKETHIEYRKQYYDENKEKLNKINKEYYLQHKEKLTELNKTHYENNKIELNKKRGEKTTCICGCIIRSGNISTHKKSQKHNDLMNFINI